MLFPAATTHRQAPCPELQLPGPPADSCTRVPAACSGGCTPWPGPASPRRQPPAASRAAPAGGALDTAGGQPLADTCRNREAGSTSLQGQASSRCDVCAKGHEAPSAHKIRPVVADLQRQACCMRGGLPARLNSRATLLLCAALGTRHGVRRYKDWQSAKDAKPQLLMYLDRGGLTEDFPYP